MQAMPDGPGGICAESCAAIEIENFRRANQRDIAIADQIVERVRSIDERFGNGNHEPQIAVHNLIADLQGSLQQSFDLVHHAGFRQFDVEFTPQHFSLVFQKMHFPEEVLFL